MILRGISLISYFPVLEISKFVCVWLYVCAGDGFIDELLDGRNFGQFGCSFCISWSVKNYAEKFVLDTLCFKDVCSWSCRPDLVPVGYDWPYASFV